VKDFLYNGYFQFAASMLCLVSLLYHLQTDRAESDWVPILVGFIILNTAVGIRQRNKFLKKRGRL
jgi:hypothetical protein